MTLQRQFTFLIASVSLLPLIIMGGSFFIFSKLVYPSNPKLIADIFFERVKDSDSLDDINYIIETLEKPYYALILNSDTENISGTSRDLKSLIVIESQVVYYQKDSFVEILFGVKLLNKDVWIFPLLFIFSILLPLIIIPVLIFRSIKSSIKTLEAATKRIAEGDLGFELKTSDNDQIGSLTKSLDKMRKQIKDEHDRRYRFFMGVSHDLMTPLSHIGGYSEALIEGLSTDEKMTEKYLKIINGKSHLLERRIVQLLDYLKSSNIEFRDDLEINNLFLFLRDFFESHSEEMSFYNKQLVWSLNIKEDLCLPFDQDLLNRALENLINNSFKYGDLNFPVTVDVLMVNNEINICVKNCGDQISDDIIGKLFEPFFRGDPSRKGDGFGLGLSSVKSIIESHGWSINVYSKNRETIFTIKIPL